MPHYAIYNTSTGLISHITESDYKPSPMGDFDVIETEQPLTADHYINPKTKKPALLKSMPEFDHVYINPEEPHNIVFKWSGTPPSPLPKPINIIVLMANGERVFTSSMADLGPLKDGIITMMTFHPPWCAWSSAAI